MLTGDKSLFCKLKNIYGEFAEKMILYHLCFLALQRTFLTISPLKAHFVLTAKLVRRVIICTYISCLILEIAFVVFEMTPCDAQDFNRKHKIIGLQAYNISCRWETNHLTMTNLSASSWHA
jgi:hypothetical protein